MSDSTEPRRKIFLSYRRDDHPDFVERIRDWFAWQYGRDSVFMDFDAIPPFTRFADVIQEKVAECDVLVAVIGPSWVDFLQRRLDESEEDYVRIEIRLALEEGKPIAPICIKGASAPRRRVLPPDLQPMMDYNVAYLNSGKHFLDNIERIVGGVDELLARIEMFSSVRQDIEVYRPPEFDVQHAILSFQDAADDEDWYAAREWLSQIRHSGFMPRFYPIEDYEREVNESIARHEAERDYALIRSMAERVGKGKESPERVWAALQGFWETYPAYDPDDLAAEFRPVNYAHADIQLEGDTLSAKGIVRPKFDPSILDQLDSINEEAVDALFSPDTLESIAERLNMDDNTFSVEDAQRLGIHIPPDI